MNRLGVIDIGPNSLRLMLTEIEDEGYFKIIDELKTSVRLCSDLVNGTEICTDKVGLILSTLLAFKSLCTVSGTSEIIAVATESFRTAKNKDLLVSTIKSELDVDVRVLSCEEEIYYNFIGVTRSIYVENSLMVEVEGANTHLAWIQDGCIINSATLPFGCVNLSYNNNLTDRVCRDDLAKAITTINNHIHDLSFLRENQFDSIILVGGTARTLGKLDRVKKRYPVDISHNYELNDLDVHEIYNLVKSKDYKQRCNIEGFCSESSDVIVGGLAIINNIIELVHNTKVIISGRGLKEGILYEYINSNHKISDDILDYSINGILDTLNSNKTHAKQVFLLSTKLFEGLKPLHHLDNRYAHIIKTASMLHDCGTSIDYYNHHKHSFYIILHSY
ncbi:MAG: Ppx/GppA phosphatase family protein, partial [Clostridium sp.]